MIGRAAQIILMVDRFIPDDAPISQFSEMIGLSEHIWPPKTVTMAAMVLLGLTTFCAGSYSLIAQILFTLRASAQDAIIVEVRHEMVPKGKTSVLAYVPVVEVPDASHGFIKILVDTYSEKSVYKVGQRLKTLCDSSSFKCIPDTFLARWGDATVLFFLSFVFFLLVFKSWRT